MSDGHSGTESKEIKRKTSRNFELVFAYLRQGNGSMEYVIHADSPVSYGFEQDPVDFLSEIGFENYRGRCPYNKTRCFYRVLAHVLAPAISERYGGYYSPIEHVHRKFEDFAEHLEELYALNDKQNAILRSIESRLPAKDIHGEPVTITLQESEVPPWINDVKFPQLRELEDQKGKLQAQIDELTIFLPLLYAAGDVLGKGKERQWGHCLTLHRPRIAPLKEVAGLFGVSAAPDAGSGFSICVSR